jgi:hypothetical protein
VTRSAVVSVLARELWLPVAAMIAIVVASNVAVQYPINDWLTWGAFTYPVSFLVTDLTNRHFGAAKTRRVVYAGFAAAVLLSVYFAGWRIALASGSAFLAAQLLDVFVFDRLRRQAWWKAPFISSFFASALDTALFFGLAFAGTAVPWVTLGLGDFAVKLFMASTLLVPYRLLMAVIKAMPPPAVRGAAGTA